MQNDRGRTGLRFRTASHGVHRIFSRTQHLRISSDRSRRRPCHGWQVGRVHSICGNRISGRRCKYDCYTESCENSHLSTVVHYTNSHLPLLNGRRRQEFLEPRRPQTSERYPSRSTRYILLPRQASHPIESLQEPLLAWRCSALGGRDAVPGCKRVPNRHGAKRGTGSFYGLMSGSGHAFPNCPPFQNQNAAGCLLHNLRVGARSCAPRGTLSAFLSRRGWRLAVRCMSGRSLHGGS